MDNKIVEILNDQISHEKALDIIDIIEVYKSACFDLGKKPCIDELINGLNQVK